MENIRLTNGTETFMLGSILEDEKGAVHGKDSRGSGYTRCDTPTCDHSDLPVYAANVWHDDENTETLWEEFQFASEFGIDKDAETGEGY
jgi:hypothetical protein